MERLSLLTPMAALPSVAATDAVPEGYGPSGELLLPQHSALLAASSIRADVAAARGYRSATDPAELEALGFAPSQRRVPALVIPLHNAAGRLAGHQIRPDHPRTDTKGRPIKYESPAGARPLIDVPPAVYPVLDDPSVPLMVTEGSRKADAAVSHGMPCVSLAGVYAFLARSAGGGRLVVPDLDEIDLQGRDVAIGFDSDVMTKPAVADALARLAAALERRGARVRAVYLTPGPNGQKVGLDDFLAAGHGRDDVLALAGPLRPADGATNRRFALIPIGEAKHRRPPDYLIHGVLVADTLAALVGESDTFKTFTALDAALSSAAGLDWQGRATRPVTAVYVSGEGVGGLGRRVAAWEANRGREASGCHLLPEAVQLLDGGEVDALLGEIAELPEPPGLIVLDTLARCAVGAEENSAKDMGMVVAGAERLRRATGACVLLLHHMGWSAGRMRGSSALYGALDTLIEARRDGAGVRLSCAKQKDDEPFRDIVLAPRVVDLGQDGAGRSVTSVVLVSAAMPASVPAPFRLKPAAEKALQALLEGGARAADWQRAAAEAGVSSRSFYRARGDLLAAGRVVQVEDAGTTHYRRAETRPRVVAGSGAVERGGTAHCQSAAVAVPRHEAPVGGETLPPLPHPVRGGSGGSTQPGVGGECDNTSDGLHPSPVVPASPPVCYACRSPRRRDGGCSTCYPRSDALAEPDAVRAESADG